MIPVKIMSGNHHGLYAKSFDSTKTQCFLRFRNDERKHAFDYKPVPNFLSNLRSTFFVFLVAPKLTCKIPDENREKNMFFSDKLIVSKTRS